MKLDAQHQQTITQQISDIEIIAFSIDLRKMVLSVGYWEGWIDSNGNFNRVNEKWITLDATNTQDAIQRASQVAGADVYGAVKQSLYEKLQQITGITGTVV